MTPEEYKTIFKMCPPKHLVKKGKVVCSVCLKGDPQVKRIMSLMGLFPCKSCTAKQSKHKPFAPVSPQEKMANMSPEEVLSGGIAGVPNQFGMNSKRGWYEEHKEEVKTALEALS